MAILDIVVPTVGESVTSIFGVRLLKKVGDFVNENDVIIEGDSDKATVEVVAPVTGQIVEMIAQQDEDFPIGQVIARIEEKAFVPETIAGGATAEPIAESLVSAPKIAKDAAPAKTEMAKESKTVITEPVQTVDHGLLEERVKMTPLRRTIARRLVEAQQTAAMLTTFNEIDLTAVQDIRQKYQDIFVKRHGTKLGFMSFFVKATIEALKEYPAVNAEIDGDEIVYKHFYNIGVAVSGPRGLMVPVVKNADQMSFADVELEIKRLSGLARDNKLKVEHFENGTFTISNGGVFGSLLSTPILNPPQVGILGMHSIQERPVNVGGQVVIRPMMYVALSYDHRIIDGKEAVSFLVRIKELVENPERILFDV